jgi:hypothetical protein
MAGEGGKALRLALLLEQLNLNTPLARRNMFTSNAADRIAAVMDPWIRTQGVEGGDVLADYPALLGQLAGYFQQGGGGMASVAGDAREAARRAASDPIFQQGGRDDDLYAMLAAFNQLASLPQNEWLQRAYGNLREGLLGDYAGFNSDPARYGTTDLLGFIRENPTYQFMTGQ